MEIKKRLIINDGEEVTAVLINDEGEEYPVFLESLHNTVYFPLLLESGYKLVSLPYGFVKNGVILDQLPVEKYKTTDPELEIMYNSIGVKLPYDEIKAKMDVKEVVGMQTPPTNYTIHTREELFEYLDATAKATTDDDFMPLNYFVAPEARLDIREYKHPDFHKYVELITRRREMSLSKFYKLVNWLKGMHLLSANYTAMDVLDAYFSWGFDGLNFTMISMHRESRAFRLMPNKNVNAPAVRKTQGFIDGAGNMLTPMNERDVVWKLTNQDSEYINELTRGLAVNDTRVVTYQCNTKQDVTIMEGTEFNIVYSTDILIMQLQTYSPIRVKSPVEIGDYLELNLALPSNIDKLFEFCTMEALAKMLYDMRKPKIKTSSYDALRIVGANPNTAINYVLAKYDMNKERRVQTEDDAPTIPYFEVDDYLDGKEVPEATKSFLDDIISGVFNIDNIGKAKSIESAVSTESVFNEIYAIHNVMGISLQEIYDKFRQIKEDDKTLVFSNGSYQHVVDVSQMRMSINGYLSDVQTYDTQCADDCTFFTYITMVAREVGDENCRRHVGIEFFMVNRSKPAVKKLLEELTAMYESKVTMTIADAVQQAKALRMKNVFALSRFFEIALKGTITWSKQLGAGVVPASVEQMNIARANLETKIENLTTYCSFTVNSVSASTLSFNAYCTNAYLTPEYVIPRGNSPIREVPFYSAWCDWAHTNPEIYAQLVGLDVLPQGFISWSSRYADQQFSQRGWEGLDSQDSLMYYYNQAVQEVHDWPVDQAFHSVTHPIEYMFPGVYDDEDSAEMLPVPRQGEPVVRLGIKHGITLEDYKDLLYPSELINSKEQYIQVFRGFSAEAMIMLGSDILTKLPAENGVPLTVAGKSEYVYVTDTQQLIHFTRLTELDTNKYPIINVYGRIYLFRTADGRVWEARI